MICTPYYLVLFVIARLILAVDSSFQIHAAIMFFLASNLFMCLRPDPHQATMPSQFDTLTDSFILPGSISQLSK